MFTERSRARWAQFVAPRWMQVLAWTGRGHHRRAERLAALADVHRAVEPCRHVQAHSRRDRALGRRPHDPGARRASSRGLTGAELLLVHVADGWAARHFDDLKLRESEEMQARSRLSRAAARRPRRRRAFTRDVRLALGDPATELIQGRRASRRRPDRHVDARPPLPRRPPPRHHRRPRPPPREGPRAAAAAPPAS